MLLSFVASTYSQHKIDAVVTIDDNLRDWQTKQEIVYYNTTDKELSSIYLYNWLYAFSDKKSPLANRYAEEFVRKFHFASAEERGGTTLKSINVQNQKANWHRMEDHPDIIKINLRKPLSPDDKRSIQLSYKQRIPEAEFTDYGYENDEISGRYWLIKPAVFREKWLLYSHKNLGDQPQQKNQYTMRFSFPDTHQLISSFRRVKTSKTSDDRKMLLMRGNIVDTKVHLSSSRDFETIITDYGAVKTNITATNLSADMRSIIIDLIMGFLNENLGNYPFEKLVVAEADYEYSPVYGLNQLPDLLRPFPDVFQYAIKFFKAVSQKHLQNTMLLNNRKNQWIIDGMQMSLMSDFVEKEFSTINLLGSISQLPVINWSHAAELDFNDRYMFLWQTMARQNYDEKLNKPQDSLLRFNQRITNAYKAGIGLNMLKEYTTEEEVLDAIKGFYRQYNLSPFYQNDFRNYFQQRSSKDIRWFFKDYINYKKPINFSVDKAEEKGDSLSIEISEHSAARLPVKLMQLKDNKVIAEQWITPFQNKTEIIVKNKGAERVAVNRNMLIPENYMANNFKAVTKLTRRPFQFRLFEDIDDQRYSQLFSIPEFTYNLYDGISPGAKVYNTSILPKNLSYKLSPKLGLRSNSLVGSAAIDYRYFFNRENKSAFSMRFGTNFSRFSYDFDLFFRRVSNFFSLVYRDNDYLRDNKRQVLNVRTVSIDRDRSLSTAIDEPDFNVVNLQYGFSNKNLDRYVTAFANYEVAQKFSKFSFTASYRKLFENNRQVNLRFFGGFFLYNDARDSDFFSFALDRPTDYLFDYNYYGRSEDSGALSQQFIFAEGGFKSQLQPAFANQWMTTVNASTTIWNWIFAYGDAGLVQNKSESTEFLYDSGIRLNLVEEYFELFFPVYSSKGFELNEPNYEENIRFIVTLDVRTLLGLFTRKWY